ncbi:MAG: recombinase family protein, partial [Gammaproteobacteria bacterium]|nr:recombinase family protein [Gammaproteobacteria bacterium]
TRRGLRGRVEKGKSGGGLSYGYNVVKKFNADGEAIKGDREINDEKAAIIRRIFDEYAYQSHRRPA